MSLEPDKKDDQDQKTAGEAGEISTEKSAEKSNEEIAATRTLVVEKQNFAFAECTTSTAIIETVSLITPDPLPSAQTETKIQDDIRDNGIFDFMTVDRAIELYKRIHSSGVPELEWKFYGRRNPNEPQEVDNKMDKQCDNPDDKLYELEGENMHESLLQTEFDFDDESFGELAADTSTIINDTLQLKNRPEPGSEKKTNLSDIMSHLMKETSHAVDE